VRAHRRFALHGIPLPPCLPPRRARFVCVTRRALCIFFRSKCPSTHGTRLSCKTEFSYIGSLSLSARPSRGRLGRTATATSDAALRVPTPHRGSWGGAGCTPPSLAAPPLFHSSPPRSHARPPGAQLIADAEARHRQLEEQRRTQQIAAAEATERLLQERAAAAAVEWRDHEAALQARVAEARKEWEAQLTAEAALRTQRLIEEYQVRSPLLPSCLLPLEAPASVSR